MSDNAILTDAQIAEIEARLSSPFGDDCPCHDCAVRRLIASHRVMEKALVDIHNMSLRNMAPGEKIIKMVEIADTARQAPPQGATDPRGIGNG